MNNNESKMTALYERLSRDDDLQGDSNSIVNHNHIIICSTDLDGQHKYRDVKQSAKYLVQISDSLCREHGLSVIQNPQVKTVTYDKWQGNQRRFTHRDELRMIIDTALRMQPDGFDALMQLLEDAGCRIKRGAQISIKPPEGKRYRPGRQPIQNLIKKF